jgi:hypothetical protein
MKRDKKAKKNKGVKSAPKIKGDLSTAPAARKESVQPVPPDGRWPEISRATAQVVSATAQATRLWLEHGDEIKKAIQEALKKFFEGEP